MTLETSISETKLLEITGQVAKPGQLEIQVKNISGAPLGEPLLIEIKLPVEWVDERIGAAARNARTSDSPANMVVLEGIVDVAKEWSVWAYNDPNDHLAAIRVFNNVDQKTGLPATALAGLQADAKLVLSVPLRRQTTLAQVSIPYSYQYGGRKAPRVDGTLEVTQPFAGNWAPRVSLTTDQANPMMIPFTTKVKISWKIADAVGAVLRGPLSGGHSELRLSSDRSSDFWIDQGSIEVRAVGPVTYLLDAEVKGPSGPPNVQVIRTVSLDISKAENYGSMRLLPDRALPHDQVEIQWAVWGVKNATILFGSHLSYTLELTEQDLSRNYHGVGVWPVRIPGDHDREVVSLRMKNDDETLPAINRDILVASWTKVPQKAQFTGEPIALAYDEKNLGLLTRDGLWLAAVGGNDTELKDPSFHKVSTDRPKTWLALAAFEKSFVALRQTSGDDLQLLRFGPDGKTQDVPLDLPGDLRPLTRLPGARFQLVAFGNRVYVVVESVGGQPRRALSAAFEPKGIRPEPLLEPLPKYQLIGFSGGLYALNRITGGVLRYDVKPGGELEGPRRAASASREGNSMIRAGLALSLGEVLIVLGPSAVSQFDDEQPRNLGGAPRIAMQPLRTPAAAREARQDLVYNPQKDKWSTCGHGLTLQAGALAAFRGGASKRLWVLQPNAEMYTLQEAGEDLYAPDYVRRFPSKVLPDALDARLEVQVLNGSLIDLAAVDSVCQAAGLTSLSAAGPVKVTPVPDEFPQSAQQKFTISYSRGDSAPVTLRFQAKGSEKGSARYVLELTFSGTALSTITSVFKRLTIDEQGVFALAEVPGTAEQHPANQIVLVPPARQLAQQTLLYLFNSTFYQMSHSPVPGTATGDVPTLKFGYATPPFDVTFPDADKIGTLHFDFDFTRPFGIEAAFKNQVRQSLLRINRDDEHMLEVTAAVVREDTKFEYEQVDGSKGALSHRPGDALACVITQKNKREINMVRVGDAVPSHDAKRFYVPLAKPSNAASIELWSFDSESFAYDKSAIQPGGGPFFVPNILVACKDRIYAMFGDQTLLELDAMMNVKSKRDYPDYKYICTLAATASGDLFLLAEKQVPWGRDLAQIQFLLVERASGQRSVFKLENVPWNLQVMAVSPDGKKVVICKNRGLLVVDTSSGKVENVDLPSVESEGDVTFSRDGAWIYCAHVRPAYSSYDDSRRPSGGNQLTVSRVRTGNLAETRTLSLPGHSGSFGVTRYTVPSRRVGEKVNEPAAFRLALSPDDRCLFVSAGRTIYKIDTASFTLSPWTKILELSSRLFQVKEGKRNTWTVFALGSDYVGDGSVVDSFKTHLYSFAAPRS
jgi:hypothetical protein